MGAHPFIAMEAGLQGAGVCSGCAWIAWLNAVVKSPAANAGVMLGKPELQAHLLELHDVRVHERSVVDNLALHILGDLC